MRLINYEQFNNEFIHVAYNQTGDYICTEKFLVLKEYVVYVDL